LTPSRALWRRDWSRSREVSWILEIDNQVKGLTFSTGAEKVKEAERTATAIATCLNNMLEESKI